MNCSIRKKALLLGLLFIFPFVGLTQKIEIKGCIVEEAENTTNPIGFVNVALLRNDSTFVVGTSSNENGSFHLKNVEKGNYLLSTSFTGYDKTYIKLENLTTSIDLGNIKIKSSLINLSEVTVSASHYVNQIDRKIIFPDDSQIKRSTDGMDLLRNLQLSGIEINRLNNSIKGARGGIAEVRINGAKVADQKELLAIQPKDIIRIEYHDEPSLRYGESEVVIDYIVRRKENGGLFITYDQKGVNANKSYLFSSGKINHKKSEFSLLGGSDYYSYKDNYRINQERFKFNDGNTLIRNEEGLPEKKKNNISTIQLGYNFLDVDKHYFVFNVGLNQYHDINNTKSLLFTEGKKEHALLMTDYNKSDSYQPYANLYYQLTMKNKQILVFDAKGDYYNPTISRNYSETKQDQTLTNITTHINGDRYWFAGEGFYEKRFEQGRLNVGIKHIRSKQQNNYSGDFLQKQKVNQATTYFYAEWMGHVEKFSYAVGVGGTQVNIKQVDYESDNIHFTPTIRMGYQFTNRFQIKYSGRITIQSPSSNDINTIDQAIDSLQIRRGNPLLKPSPYYNNMLTLSYDKKPFSVNLQIEENYHHRPVMESSFEENGKIIHQMENQDGLHQLTATIYTKASLMDGNLNLNTRSGINSMKSWGGKYNHTLNNWFISGGIDYTWKKWNPFWSIDARRINLRGETVSYSNQSTYCGLRFKLKNFSTSAYFKHTIGWESKQENLNQYASNHIYNYSPSTRNMFFVDIFWSFQFGRRYNGSQKKIDSSMNDMGIKNLSK